MRVHSLVVLAVAVCVITACAAQGGQQTSDGDCAEIAGSGNFEGTVENETVQSDAPVHITLSQSGCVVEGRIIVDPPLAGSGPFNGTVSDRQVEFVVAAATNDVALDLAFEGEMSDLAISGRYVVRGTNESGRWVVFDTGRIDEVRAELFWIAATTLGGISDETPFEVAKFRLFDVLFAEWDSAAGEMKQYGVDPFEDWPYCISAVTVAMELGDMIQSSSAAEAGPFSNAAAEVLSGMDVEVMTAREFSNRGFTHEESLRLCREFEDDARASRGWPPSQVN